MNTTNAFAQSKPVTGVKHPLDVFERLDVVKPGSTGAFFYGDPKDPVGTVLLDEGRVCWAVARGMRHRLTDLLREESVSAVDEAKIKSIYNVCRQERRPLASALVEEGVVSHEGFRNVIRRHTTEAMLEIGATGEQRRSWIERRRGHYASKVSFSSLDLVLCVGELLFVDQAEEARAHLDDIVPAQARGIAFMRTEGRAGVMPIAGLRSTDIKVRDAGAMGKWAMSAISGVALLGAERPSVSVTGAGGESLVAWARGPMIFTALSDDRGARAWMEVQLARARKQGAP